MTDALAQLMSLGVALSIKLDRVAAAGVRSALAAPVIQRPSLGGITQSCQAKQELSEHHSSPFSIDHSDFSGRHVLCTALVII